MRYLVRRHPNADDDDKDVKVVWQLCQSEWYEKEVALNENLRGNLLEKTEIRAEDPGGGREGGGSNARATGNQRVAAGRHAESLRRVRVCVSVYVCVCVCVIV